MVRQTVRQSESQTTTPHYLGGKSLATGSVNLVSVSEELTLVQLLKYY